MALIVHFPVRWLAGRAMKPGDHRSVMLIITRVRLGCVRDFPFFSLLAGQVSGMLLLSRCGESAFLRFSDAGERRNTTGKCVIAEH
jgi:hypothetical protein